MLNKKGERELAYLVKIDDIQPIIGSDNCESAVVGAWHIMTRKGTFVPGDYAIYFEIDSLLDVKKPEFSFMEKYGGKVKTQRYTFGGKGNFISQGLLMHPSDFGWSCTWNVQSKEEKIIDKEGKSHKISDESRFLTSLLGVHYNDPTDEQRKGNGKKKQPAMPKFFYVGIGRKMMKVKWLKPILIKIFGKKVKVTPFPYWVVKTDEERVQNIPDIIHQEDKWIATEKIDGSSSTYTMIRHGKKLEFYMCSRNVVFTSKEDKCYYDSNIYVDIASKYPFEETLKKYLIENKDVEWVTIQGEIYGQGVQKRDYSIDHKDFAAFNLIDSKRGRWNSCEAKEWLSQFGIPFVPILNDSFEMPDTVDELLEFVNGNSVLDGKPREGMVFRSLDGVKSFKAVSNTYLLKYHS